MYLRMYVRVCTYECVLRFLIHPPGISQTQQRMNPRSRVLRSTWATSLYIYICVCACVYVYVYIHIYVYVRVYGCTYMHVLLYMLIGSYICIWSFFVSRIVLCVSNCVCVSICVCPIVVPPPDISQAQQRRNPRSQLARPLKCWYVCIYVFMCVCVLMSVCYVFYPHLWYFTGTDTEESEVASAGVSLSDLFIYIHIYVYVTYMYVCMYVCVNRCTYIHVVRIHPPPSPWYFADATTEEYEVASAEVDLSELFTYIRIYICMYMHTYIYMCMCV